MRLPAIASLATALVFLTPGNSQTTPAASDGVPSIVKVCSAENPPPCADTRPLAIHAPEPRYPDEAQHKHIQGIVVLAAIVGENGRVVRAVVTQGLGGGLDEEAVKTIKKWKFKPAKMNGRPVTVEVSVVINFQFRK